MRRHIRDSLVSLAAGARADARHAIMYGVLKGSSEVAASELRATINVYLRGKR